MPRSPIFFMALLYRVQIPYLFDGSPTSCLDPLSFRRLFGIVSGSPWSFQRFSGIVFGSPIVSAALRHRVRILYLFNSSHALCLDPLLFWRASRSPIFSATLWHRVRIPYFFDSFPASCPNPLSFRGLSSIVFGSSIFSVAFQHRVWIPYFFGGSPTSCLDPLSFRQFSGIVSRSPIFLAALRHCVRISYLFDGSLTLCLDPFFFSTVLRYRARIPYRFDSSPTLCLNPFIFSTALWHHFWIPLSFQQLSGIMSGFPIFSATLWHHVRIPYHFNGSPTLCPNHLVLNHCGPTPLAFDFFTIVHFYSFIVCALCSWTTRSFTLLKKGIFVDPQFCPLTLACILGVSPAPNFLYVTAMDPLLGLIGFRTSHEFTYGSI